MSLASTRLKFCQEIPKDGPCRGVLQRYISGKYEKKNVSATTRPRALMVIGIINFTKLFFLTFIVDTMISNRT